MWLLTLDSLEHLVQVTVRLQRQPLQHRDATWLVFVDWLPEMVLALPLVAESLHARVVAKLLELRSACLALVALQRD